MVWFRTGLLAVLLGMCGIGVVLERQVRHLNQMPGFVATQQTLANVQQAAGQAALIKAIHVQGGWTPIEWQRRP